MTTNALRDAFADLIYRIAQGSTQTAVQTVIGRLTKDSPANQRWPTDQEVIQFLSNQQMKGTNNRPA